MAGSWSTTKPKIRSESIRIEDEIEIAEFPKNKWVKVRFIGPINSAMNIWFEIIGSKTGKKSSIPKICLDYNPETEEFDKEICPYRKLGVGKNTQFYITNMIIRDIQEDGPGKKASKPTEYERKTRTMCGEKVKLKEKGSKTWTPVRARTWSATLAEKFASLKGLNVVKNKEGKKIEYDISHPKYGRDISLKYNPDSKSPIKWDINIGDRSPLTEEELAYLLQPIEGLESLKPKSLGEAKQDAKQLESVLANKDKRKDVDDDDDDEPKKKKSKHHDEDDDEEDDEPVVKKKKKKVVEEEEEDDEDEDDDDSDEDSDDEDEDDDDEDSDEDEEDEDDDEEDDEPVVRKKKKKVVEEDDEDDEPRSKKKKASKDKVKKKKKPKDEFEDDDEF